MSSEPPRSDQIETTAKLQVTELLKLNESSHMAEQCLGPGIPVNFGELKSLVDSAQCMPCLSSGAAPINFW